MNYYDISFSTVLGALRHQKRVFCVVMALFILIGTAAGCYFAKPTAAPADGSAASLQPISYDSVLDGIDYYSSCYNLLTTCTENISQYLEILSNSELTEDQSALIMDLELQLSQFRSEHLNPIDNALSERTNIYIPISFLDEYAATIEESLVASRLNIIYYRESAELIKNMEAPTLENENITEVYNSLLNQAQAYGSTLQNIARLEIIQEKLQDRIAVKSNAQFMERKLLRAEHELSTLSEAVNEAAASIAAENHVNVQIIYEANNDAIITLTHTHDTISPQDNFVLMVTFSTIVGAALGLFFAVVREAKNCKTTAEV